MVILSPAVRRTLSSSTKQQSLLIHFELSEEVPSVTWTHNIKDWIFELITDRQKSLIGVVTPSIRSGLNINESDALDKVKFCVVDEIEQIIEESGLVQVCKRIQCLQCNFIGIAYSLTERELDTLSPIFRYCYCVQLANESQTFIP